MMICVMCNTNKAVMYDVWENSGLICGACAEVCFWDYIVENKNDLRYVIIKRKLYYIGDSKIGQVKAIKRFDLDREITTKELKYKGLIPDEYDSLLPDNAEFVVEKEREKDWFIESLEDHSS